MFAKDCFQDCLMLIPYQHQTARIGGHLFSTAVVFFFASSCSQKDGNLSIFSVVLFIAQVVEKCNASHKTDYLYHIVLCTQESIIILVF